MFEITVKRHRRKELLMAIADNEERGFKVVSQIHCTRYGKRTFKYDAHDQLYRDFDHTEEYEMYAVRMRKVEPNEHIS
jgi:hypothetical protein